MTRAILDSSAKSPPLATDGIADLQPLDHELASQLPSWDLVPPHSFLVRKPRTPKPVAVNQPPVEAAPSGPLAVEPEKVAGTLGVEFAADPAPLAAEASAPEPEVEVEAEVLVTDVDAQAAPSPAMDADNCTQCRVPLQPDSVFCPECGHKQ
jgi:hypothetical protein